MSEPVIGVVMVSASFHPYIGGAEKQALELSAALRLRGLSVRVATRRLPGLAAREEIRGVPVFRLSCFGTGLTNAVSFMGALAWFLWSQSEFYEVIHVHLAGSPSLVAAVMGRLLGKRVFVKLGGGVGVGELSCSARTRSGRLKLRLLSWLSPQLLAVAGDLAAEARRYLGEVPVMILPNGVDTQRYKPAPSPEARQALRQRLGWPARGLVFLYVGRLSPEKRLPLFVELWAEAVKASRASAVLALVGEGSEEPAIRSAAVYSRLQDKILIHAPMPDVEAAYKAADIFVLPSASEGLSNALLEAMASGLAVLASRVGGTPEAVEDSTSGFLFAPGDAEDAKAQLAKYLERPELPLVMGRAARRAAVERFSLEKTAERCEALYRFGAP